MHHSPDSPEHNPATPPPNDEDIQPVEAETAEETGAEERTDAPSAPEGAETAPEGSESTPGALWHPTVPYPSTAPTGGAVASRSGRTLLVVALVAIVALLMAATGIGAYYLGTNQSSVRPVVVDAGEMEEGLAARVYEAAGPSTVSVITPGVGSGSGFFYKENMVVTNAHVILNMDGRPALDVEIRLEDGRLRQGRVLGADIRMDIAIIEVENAEEVRPLSFTESTEASPGDPVVVIGSPLDLYSSVSEGIVSAVRRNTAFRTDPVQSQFIQTDAAVNPGNSGGPLLDANGQVLGIMTLRPDESGMRPVDGVSFAVPSEAVIASIAQLEQNGTAEYVVIGIAGQSTNPDDPAQGMKVEELSPEGPAETAGVEVGDIITMIDGTPTPSYEDVAFFLLTQSPGDSILLTLFRDGETFEQGLVLEARPLGT